MYNLKEWLFYDIDRLQKNIVSYKKSLGPKILEYYVTSNNTRTLDQLYLMVNNFLDSDSQTLNLGHLNLK